MPRSADLWIGILMVLTGLYVLAWMPTLRKRLAKLEQSGERTAEEVRRELKTMKLVMIASLVVGSGMVCIYAFKLYD